jgi:membrane-associated HD superfamily phosphohydrolase
MILDWFERRRLVRKGLACDKTRLSHSDDTLQTRAETSWKMRLAILGSFLLLLHLGVAWPKLGANVEDHILAFIVYICGLMLLELDCPEVWRSNSKLVLIFGAIWFNLLVVKGIFLNWPSHDPAAMSQIYFLCPFAFAPFLVTLLLGTRVGLFSVASACSRRCCSIKALCCCS